MSYRTGKTKQTDGFSDFMTCVVWLAVQGACLYFLFWACMGRR